MLAERVIEWTRDWKEQGLREGRQEGRQQGWQEGLIRSAQESVSAALAIRFGATPVTVERSVNRVDDLTLLRALLKEAILASNMTEFERILATYQRA